MRDKNNEFQPGGSSDDADKRAEKIRAIKNSIRNGPVNRTEPAVHTDSYSESAVSDNAEQSAPRPEPEVNDWESQLAARIARRVQKVKNSKNNSAESILDELDGIIASNEETIEDASALNAEYTEKTENADAEAAEAVESETMDSESENSDNEISDDETQKKKKVKKKKKKKSLKKKFLGLFPQKKDSVGERIRKIVFLVSVTVSIVLICIIASYYIDIYTTEGKYKELIDIYNQESSEITETSKEEYDGEYYSILPNAERLLGINSDIVGVINIPGTEVNYPVVQAADNIKYLDKNIMGEKAKAGSLFLDYRNSFDRVVDGKLVEPTSDNLIIYGHNMENGMMFGTLKQYRNNVNYYGEHPIIELNSNYAHYKYKIFAFFIIDAEDKTDTAFECWNKLNFTDETDFYDFVNEAKRRTIRLNDVDVRYGDKLLTLSTCNGIFGDDGPARLIVMARLVRDDEELLEGTQNSIKNPNIKWPSLYYSIRKNEKYDPDAEFVPYGETAEDETTSED